MNDSEEMTCFEWHFTNSPKLANYAYCDTVQECRRLIERQYCCSSNDYRIAKKQIRIMRQNDKMKHYSQVIYEEEIFEERKEINGHKKSQKKFRPEREDASDQRHQTAEQLMLLLAK